MKEKKVNRTFSQEFKNEAVELAKRVGNNQAAKDLGVNEASIRNWRKKELPVQGPHSLERTKSYEELAKENRQLQKEIGYLKEINQVLKKSTAIFSVDHLGSLK